MAIRRVPPGGPLGGPAGLGFSAWWKLLGLDGLPELLRARCGRRSKEEKAGTRAEVEICICGFVVICCEVAMSQ